MGKFLVVVFFTGVGLISGLFIINKVNYGHPTGKVSLTKMYKAHATSRHRPEEIWEGK